MSGIPKGCWTFATYSPKSRIQRQAMSPSLVEARLADIEHRYQEKPTEVVHRPLLWLDPGGPMSLDEQKHRVTVALSSGRVIGCYRCYLDWVILALEEGFLGLVRLFGALGHVRVGTFPCTLACLSVEDARIALDGFRAAKGAGED